MADHTDQEREPGDPLTEYRQKRSFDVTSEPAGTVAQGQGNLYVVQEHHARRLHWDLRLEYKGVLLSWAVPKGPPERHGLRRLAVKVEDHPLEYATFVGEIPKGNYGAGHVHRWDMGTWRPIGEDEVETQLRAGKLEFVIEGERMKGDFVLVLTDKEKDEWLWMKMKTKSHKETPKPKPVEPPPPSPVLTGPKQRIPDELEPMLCTRVDQVPSAEGWVHEIKWDGYRVLAFVKEWGVEFKTRNGLPIYFSKLANLMARVLPPDSIIDGEVVVFDEKGVSRFPLLQRALAEKKTDPACFIAFDLPFAQGVDIRQKPLVERKALLQEWLAVNQDPKLRYSAHHAGDGRPLFSRACEIGLEGIISKKGESAYRSVRSPEWVKVRCEKKIEVWVGGFMLMANSTDMVGSILVGTRGADGRLQYLGKVGSGFSEALRRKLFKEFRRRERPPFDPEPGSMESKDAVWVETTHLAQVQFLDWSGEGLLRQAKLVGIERSQTHRLQLPSNPIVKISNPDRIIDPSSGHTKGEVAAYYQAVAKQMLRFVGNRPISMVRAPEGITEATFFQKHRMAGLPDSVHSVTVKESDEKEEPYVYVDSAEGLLALVQMGVLEFHSWGSQADDLERPDVLVFDLDPGDDVEWRRVVEAAHHVRGALQALGFEPLTKVTGGKGIHLVVPVDPSLEWPEAKAFCENFAKNLSARDPKRYLAKLSKAARQGRILIDYLRNGRGATAVAPYSLRARPNLPVALPVDWDELGVLGPGAITPSEAVRRVEEADDPWADYEKCRRPWPANLP
ncbi:MAG: DNA ligase D [Fimbriimonadaceae bacterium]|nr:DNA ligase D [Fimbriimonadaceae bacterium]QYK56403.1 MAG: DNA ligase D [Fimbriimonadaceae bacterium]